MNPLYNLGIRAYAAAVRLAAISNSKAAKLTAGQRNTLARLRDGLAAGNGPVVWVHAASLGEFEQGRPLIERLRREQPGVRIVLSFFSPSGYEVRKDYPLADAVVYLPFDTPRRVRKFIDAVNPREVYFIKYEFWGNYLQELSRRKIPVYLVSAIFRPTQSFFKPWGGTFRDMLRSLRHIFVQDEESRRLLAGIGVTAVTVAGDTRFDRVAAVRSTPCKVEGIERVMTPDCFRFVAGSSWPEDERIYLPWLDSQPGMKFIIAPHEFDAVRLDRLVAALPHRRVMLMSRWIDAGKPADIDGLVVDSFGLLSSLYRYGDVAYIGGGFGAGIHNINEAAVYGMPVIFGPEHHKFREARGLMECGGGYEVAGPESFTGVVTRLQSNPQALAAAGQAAGDYIRDNLGATDRVYESVYGTPDTVHTSR
ncbi:MAG: 3-deoxy-D-manno-octulosonic acid transferase [Candidatus Amulumruptor caecigallinarius]|nr:3-deoxy-D-manno-octulosonic acid transferase [Candidatus Amulumruptor caecigallinarius]MCM1396305.1 3-deoxy-D-manno-octulosonic acid transferase [Candidatus Amulumruptor caecigallinarius]MCM1453753.1 3-deoxy-D-manno-octulosonic acid transferase [bacterium]